MDFSGAPIGTLEYSALSPENAGPAITSTANIPAPVDYQFLGGATDPGPSTRERWFVEELLKFDRRRR